jgi:hypothetical protein
MADIQTMKKILLILILAYSFCGMQIANKSQQSIEEKILDSMLLSMLRQYESGSKPEGKFSSPYPDSILVQIRVTAGGDSVKKLLDKIGILQFPKPIVLGCISCYVKPKHLRALVNHPYIGNIRVVIGGRTR